MKKFAEALSGIIGAIGGVVAVPMLLAVLFGDEAWKGLEMVATVAFLTVSSINNYYLSERLHHKGVAKFKEKIIDTQKSIEEIK